jgi:hypothetical protein
MSRPAGEHSNFGVYATRTERRIPLVVLEPR